MLDHATRMAILRLRQAGNGTRAIARALGISRGAVLTVLERGTAEVPPLARSERGAEHHEEIQRLHAACKGNLVRVHEELRAAGADLSYQALTGYCRRHGIGYAAPKPAGRYEFGPGQEMQHDTSPHVAVIDGRKRKVQTASLVLCHSRMQYFQCYPRFRRLECKSFLTEAITYFGGACSECMVDNTHVIVWRGTGRAMVPAPEIEAFGERFGFRFRAHELGDANRSARVERPFDYIDNNFLAGRTFRDWDDLGEQARAWCDAVNARTRRALHASPRDLLAVERRALKPLPLHVPEVYELHHRLVDAEGYVNVQRNRYSVPYQLMGRRLEVRESLRRIEVYDGPRLVASHVRVVEAVDARSTLPEHRPPRREAVFARRAEADERRLVERVPEAGAYLTLLRARGRGMLRDVRWLSRLAEEYPLPALRAATAEATHYGLVDLERLERMVLRRVARDFFPRAPDGED